jgi:hypothetical protein
MPTLGSLRAPITSPHCNLVIIHALKSLQLLTTRPRWYAGSEALAHATTAAQKAGRDDEDGRTEGQDSAKQASKLIHLAVDVMEEAQAVVGRATRAGRYVNITVIEAMKTQAAAVKELRGEVEELLEKSRFHELTD